MQPKRFGRRGLLYFGGTAAAVAAGGFVFIPRGNEHTAYPFAHRMAGAHAPLLRIEPAVLALATEDDAARLKRLLTQLEQGVGRIAALDTRLANAQVGELSGAEREKLRLLWWQVFEPILAIDELKERYQFWYGIDYVKQPRLHARGFALSFAALCAQVDSGLTLLQVVSGKKLLPILFDEAMPSMGLPSRTFSRLRKEIGRARDLLLLPMGNDWFEHWIQPNLRKDSKFQPLLGALEPLRKRAEARALTPTTRGVGNKLDVLQGELFERWFPLQKNLAEWAGDTRFAEQGRRLISDAQLATFKAVLEPR